MRPDSVIDLLVEFEPTAKIGIFKFESLSEELAALIGRRVDLVTKSGLKSWIRPQVLKEARIIYAPHHLTVIGEAVNRNLHSFAVGIPKCRGDK